MIGLGPVIANRAAAVKPKTYQALLLMESGFFESSKSAKDAHVPNNDAPARSSSVRDLAHQRRAILPFAQHALSITSAAEPTVACAAFKTATEVKADDQSHCAPCPRKRTARSLGLEGMRRTVHRPPNRRSAWPTGQCLPNSVSSTRLFKSTPRSC